MKQQRLLQQCWPKCGSTKQRALADANAFLERVACKQERLLAQSMGVLPLSHFRLVLSAYRVARQSPLITSGLFPSLSSGCGLPGRSNSRTAVATAVAFSHGSCGHTRLQERTSSRLGHSWPGASETLFIYFSSMYKPRSIDPSKRIRPSVVYINAQSSRKRGVVTLPAALRRVELGRLCSHCFELEAESAFSVSLPNCGWQSSAFSARTLTAPFLAGQYVRSALPGLLRSGGLFFWRARRASRPAGLDVSEMVHAVAAAAASLG